MDRLDRFRKADWGEQRKMLDDVAVKNEVKACLGSEAADELFELAKGSQHLAQGPRNIVVVPGVMGSVLQSKGQGGIWWLDMLRARGKLNELALDADGSNDLDPKAEIEPCAIDIDYAPMRAAISDSGVYGGSVQFPYDWRKPLAASAGLLRDLILKVREDYGKPVHMIGHSMGGLMIRTTLMIHGDELWPKVGRIVFIATPHYGSTSIAGYLKNHLWGFEQLALVGAFISRETIRSLWGVLSLMPAPAGIYPGTRNGEPHPCANFDLYDPDAYRLGLDAAATLKLQRAFAAASVYYQQLYDWHMNRLAPAHRQRMLQIAGVGQETLFRLETQDNWLGLWSKMNRITARQEGDPHRDGDGRVPLASAELEKIHCRYVKGSHGSVQNIGAVVKDALAWVDEKALSLPSSPKAALGSHLAGGPASSAPHLDGSADKYDRYRDIPETRVQELVARWGSAARA